MRKKRNLTTDELLKKYKRKYRITLALLAFFISVSGIYLYLNYDYLAFKHFMTQFYIYTDTLDELYRKDLKLDPKGHYYSHFDDFVISTVTQRIRDTNSDRYTYLYTPDSFNKYKQEEKEEASASEFKILDNATSYLHLTNFSAYTAKFLQSKLEEMKKYPNLIIDLRDNLGGDSEEMNKMLAYFLPKGSIISTDSLRMLDWTYKVKRKTALSFHRIAILQNKNSASASENFIAAMKENLDNVLLIGDTTYGKGIGQFTLPLKSGFAVKATILKWYTPKGNNIHKTGIQPDIRYENEDIVLFALNKLSE